MATCERCGARCQGSRCAGCEQIAANEARHGVPSDRYEDEKSSDDGDTAEWAVEQQGLDGGIQGQARLDGGIVKPDGGERFEATREARDAAREQQARREVDSQQRKGQATDQGGCPHVPGDDSLPCLDCLARRDE